MDFLVAATYHGAQIATQHACVRTCNDDIRIGFGAVTANAAFKLLDILYLINQDIIVFCSV